MTRYFFSHLRRLAVHAGLLGLLLSPAALPVHAEELSSVEKGRELAQKLCVKCHAIGRDGDSPMAEAPPFRTFPSKWPLEGLEEALAEGIVVGHPAMPEFMLEPNDIQNLLSHIDAVSK